MVLDALVAVLAYRVARRTCSEPLALLAFAATAAAMAYPPLPHPNPAVIALGLGAILVARRSPIAAGVLSGLAVFFYPLPGIAAVAGALLASTEAREPWRRAVLQGLLAAGITAGALFLPFVAADSGSFFDQALGFAVAVPGLKRSPFPLSFDGPLDLDEVVRFDLPLLPWSPRPSGRCSRWSAGLRCRRSHPPCWRSPASATCSRVRTTSTSSRWPPPCRSGSRTRPSACSTPACGPPRSY